VYDVVVKKVYVRSLISDTLIVVLTYLLTPDEFLGLLAMRWWKHVLTCQLHSSFIPSYPL